MFTKFAPPFFIPSDSNFKLRMHNIWIIGKHISGGLEFLHAHGHAHRDLKPSNGTHIGYKVNSSVLYCSDFHLWKLTDFGLCSEATSKVARPTLNRRGTKSYRAPELLLDDSTFTNKVDVWSLGCILHELVTLKTAFHDDWEVRQFYESTDSSLEISIPSSSFFHRDYICECIRDLLQRQPSQRPRVSDLTILFQRYIEAYNFKRSDIVIGIDFGTTFTGVAYAHAAGIGPRTSTAEMRMLAERVYVIKNLPSGINQFREKTPTILAYNQRPPTWGAMVKLSDEPKVSHFKLGLQGNLNIHYHHHSGQAQNNAVYAAEGYLLDPDWRHPALPEMSAVDYTGDYLTCIIQYVMQKVFPSRYGKKFLEDINISYVATVPSIWSDKTKQRYRQAMFRAGIEQENLTLITEHEAAAVYCTFMCEEVDLQQGDRFMICDAGEAIVVCCLVDCIMLILRI
jgi:serine/threonine protein kinase